MNDDFEKTNLYKQRLDAIKHEKKEIIPEEKNEKELSDIEKLEKKIEALKNRKQDLLQKERKKERAERTRRLVQYGAIFEKYFDIPDLESAEKIALFSTNFVKSNKEKWSNYPLNKK